MNTNFISRLAIMQFTDEVFLQLPAIQPQVLETVKQLFSIHGDNTEQFNYYINELGQEHNDLKPKIINIANGIWNKNNKRKTEEDCNDRLSKRMCLESNYGKRKAEGELEHSKTKWPRRSELDADEQALPSANEFLDQLIKDGEYIDCLDEKLAHLMMLLSAENQSIASAAWLCLDKLKPLENVRTFFCTTEKLSALMSLLEKFAKSHRENLAGSHSDSFVMPLFTDPTSFSSRLIAQLLPLQPFQDIEPIARAVNCFSLLLTNYQKKLNINLYIGHEEVNPLMALLHSENDKLGWASLCIQNYAIWEPAFDRGLQVEGIEKHIGKLILLLKNTKNADCMTTIFNYLIKLHNHFHTEEACKPIFNALPATLIAIIEEEELAIQPFCFHLKAITEANYRTAFCQAGGLNRMLALLQNYSTRYQAALEEQKEPLPETIAQQEGRIIALMQSLSTFSSSFDASLALNLCENLTKLLKQSNTPVFTSAALELAKLSKASKEILDTIDLHIGLQCIPLLVDFLIVKDVQKVNAALFGLKELSWTPKNQEYLLKTQAFEHVKALLLDPQDLFLGNALLCWSECIKAKGKIENADLPFIQKILFPALNGKHISPAIKSLYTLLSVEGFPLPLGREILETVLWLRKSTEKFVVECAYWCLGRLAKLDLAEEIYKTGISNEIETLLDTENTPATIIEGMSFCLCETVIPVFKERGVQETIICLASRLLDKKYPKAQETGCWLLHTLMCKFPSCLIEINHASFAKGIKLLGSPSEAVAKGAMWLSGKLCSQPSNYDENLLGTAYDNLLEWIQKGEIKTKILALRVIEPMCVAHPAIRSVILKKGALDKLLPLNGNTEMLANGLRSTLPSIIASLSNEPEAHAPLRVRYHERFIMANLKLTIPNAAKAMIQILANIIKPGTLTTRREEAFQLIWSFLLSKETDATFYANCLLVLSKLLSVDDIKQKLQNATDRSKENFLIFLSILSKQHTDVPLFPYVSSTPSPYKAWHKPCEKTKLSDITLQVDGGTFLYCHKIVLANYCDYFKGMFLSDMQEGYASLIEINEVDPYTFKKFIQFLYEQVFHFTTIKEATDLLIMAQKFCAPTLEAACIQELTCRLTPETVEEIFSEALASQSIQLKSQVMQWMMHHYLQLPEILQEYIQEDGMWSEFCNLFILDAA